MCIFADLQELEDRARFLKKLIEKYAVPGMPAHGPLAELPPLSEEEAIQVRPKLIDVCIKLDRLAKHGL